MEVSTNIKKNIYQIVINDKPFDITYPQEVSLKEEFNKTVLENVAFSLTWFFSFRERVNYKFQEIYFKDFMLKASYSDIPTIADDNNLNLREMQKKYSDGIKRIFFKEGERVESIFNKSFSDRKKAMLMLSFGKDSLLSFGLARELGLEVSAFLDSDTVNYGYEIKKRKELAEKFSKEFGTKIYNLDDSTDLTVSAKDPKYMQDLQGSALLLYYALLTTPLNYVEKPSFLVVGNEQNLNDTFLTKDNIQAHVTADQNSEFMKEASELLLKFTNKNQGITSLIEPIYNLLEYRLLHYRYKTLLKYIMSCSNESLKAGRWCYSCPMCAKSFLYTIAVGADPEVMGFAQNFFDKKYEKFYPLFDKNPGRIYERPIRVREEQLFAFYLASKAGAKGYLVEKFKKEYLQEAREREEELHKLFFGLHSTLTIPGSLKGDLLSIYREELAEL